MIGSSGPSRPPGEPVQNDRVDWREVNEIDSDGNGDCPVESRFRPPWLSIVVTHSGKGARRFTAQAFYFSTSRPDEVTVGSGDPVDCTERSLSSVVATFREQAEELRLRNRELSGCLHIELFVPERLMAFDLNEVSVSFGRDVTVTLGDLHPVVTRRAERWRDRTDGVAGSNVLRRYQSAHGGSDTQLSLAPAGETNLEGYRGFHVEAGQGLLSWELLELYPDLLCAVLCGLIQANGDAVCLAQQYRHVYIAGLPVVLWLRPGSQHSPTESRQALHSLLASATLASLPDELRRRRILPGAEPGEREFVRRLCLIYEDPTRIPAVLDPENRFRPPRGRFVCHE